MTQQIDAAATHSDDADASSTQTIAALTSEEKVALVSGYGLWRTRPVERLGIPSIVMADGPNGLRFSREQVDESPVSGGDFSDFIGLVTRRGEAAPAKRLPAPATCFPTAATVATSWDVKLAEDLGRAFAHECRSFGVSVLLGPGMNIRRTPLAGRSSEYYSEDPLLTGVMASNLVIGLQSEGVGACIKHFAANNSEIERTSMDSVIDERALRDIYLRGFERVVRTADPWSVMSSYNRVNGQQAAQNPRLLETVLRDEWGFGGPVISDWHGITDRPAALRAGNDLDMPQSRQRMARLADAHARGEVTEAELDRAVARVLGLVDRAVAGAQDAIPFDVDAHHELARRIAREGTVLLANDGTLPLDARLERIAVIGQGAAEPVIQGFGSARMIPTQIDVPLEAIGQRTRPDSVVFAVGVGGPQELAEAVAIAAASQVAIIFAHTDQNADGENADRPHLRLEEGYDDLIAAVAAAAPRTVVVLTVPDAVEMPWLDDVSAVLAPFYAGQGMGDATAALLFGEESPSGKLATTFPQRVEDTPAFFGYPGEAGEHIYVEGPFVGYRGYDARGIKPLFPFGHGLSYTTFAMTGANIVGNSVVGPHGVVTVDVELCNTGPVRGAEVVQIYASSEVPRVRTAPVELVGFAKIALNPGESTTARIVIDADDLAHWDTRRGQRLLDDGPVTLRVGTSSRRFDYQLTVQVRCDVPRWRPLRRDTETMFVMQNPHARAAVTAFLARKLGIQGDAAEPLLEQCVKSFVNVFDTLANRFQFVFDEPEVEGVIDEALQAEMAQSAQ